MCIELDLSWWPLGGRVKIGVKRSPIRTPAQAQALAREIVRRPGLELAALMGYEAHIAGLGDRPLGQARCAGAALIRFVKRRLRRRDRRAARGRGGRRARGGAVPIVNGGGTGSIHTTTREDVVTEITAGSGFYAPTLFDRYSSFSLTPAAMFAHARGAQAEPVGGHAAGRRLSRLRRRRAATGCPHRTSRAAFVLTPWKGRARCRPR